MQSVDQPPKSSFLRSLLASPLFWAAVVAGIVFLLLTQAPMLRDRYTVL